MLKSLSVTNYALIESLEIDFISGFSVITGETGAGKSIILGALSLILGQRAETKSLKDKSKKCVVEGTFDISRFDLKPFFEKQDLDFDPITLLRREISPAGKSRAFVNDTPVSLSVMKELGSHLIDVHSQHQNLLLGDSGFQLMVVDVVAEHSELVRVYKKAYKKYRATCQALDQVKEKARKAVADLDYFQFQYQQLEEAQLVEGEQKELEKEQVTLENAEEIQRALSNAAFVMQGEEMGILNPLREVRQKLSHVASFNSHVEGISQRLESAYLELQDIAQEVEMHASELEYNPQRLSFIQERLDVIYSLQRKHQVDSETELLQIFEKLGERINSVASFEEQTLSLQKELEIAESHVTELALQLSESRITHLGFIEEKIVNMLHCLGMGNAQIKINCDKSPHLLPSGQDIVTFLFTANKNGEMQDIPSVASGGEMSRVMLSIKALISSVTALPAIVFDEIDTGVSGDIADKMGLIMQQMGANMQVISITHLPQIAARGEGHYKVYKTDDSYGTHSNIRLLDETERVREIAQMVSGENLTDTALKNASELLKEGLSR